MANIGKTRDLMIGYYLLMNYLLITHGDGLFDMPVMPFVFYLS